MGSVVEIIPFIIAAIAAPVSLTLVLLLLRGEEGVVKALAFTCGAIVVRFAQGLVFGRLFEDAEDSGGANEIRAIVATLLLVIGVVMWITAITTIFFKEHDPDAPPPKWLAVIGSLTVLKAFGAGALLMVVAVKHWVFTLAVLGTIVQDESSRAEGALAFLVYVVGASSLMLAAITLRIVIPERSTAILDASAAWLERNSRMIKIVVSVIFGTYFLWKGITGTLD